MGFSGPATTYPRELFAKTCSPSAEPRELHRLAGGPRGNAAALLVDAGVSLSASLANTHEQTLEAYERFVADYLAAAAARSDRRALYEAARLAAPALIEARRALGDRRELQAIEQEIGRIQAEDAKARLTIRAPLAVQQVAIVNELTEPVAKTVSFVADFVPYLGQAKLLLEAGTGRSMMGLGAPTAPEDRMISAAVAAVPFASRILKAGARATAQSVLAVAAKTGRSPHEVLRFLRGARALGREGTVLREALDRTQAGKALTAEQAAALGRARAHMRPLYATGAGLVDKIDVAAEGAYEAIRRNSHDVAKVAQTMGLSIEVVARAKRHLFLDKHVISTVAGQKPVVSNFVAIQEYAALWQKAEAGAITAEERASLMNLIVRRTPSRG